MELMSTLRVAFNLDPASEVKKVIQDLDKAMQNCQHCHAMLEVVEHQQATAICPISIQKKSIQDAAKAREKELLKGTKSMVPLVSGIEGGVSEEQLATMKDKNKDKDKDKDKPDRSKANGHGAFVVDDWTQARIGWFSRPKTGPDMPMVTSLHGCQLLFQRYFDDYYNGPMLTDLNPIPQAIMGYNASLVYLANQITLTPWTLFKDYDYRLLPNFTQNFYLGKPAMFKEHLCPIGLPNPLDSITAYHAQHFGRDGTMVDTNDLLYMGAEELLALADEDLDDTIILTGKTQDDQYILLDLQRDAVKPKNILYSCDIDSLIWVTQTLKFIGPFGVYASLVIRDKAPIWKNNHVHVELLFP
jgi:hypothetical protein